MPAIVTIPDVLPNDLRKGDQLDVPGFGPVASTSIARKYVHVTDVDGKTVRLELGVPVVVERSEKTAEEKAAELRAYTIERHTRTMERALASAEDTIKTVSEQIAEGAFMDHWDLERLVQAQAERRIWAQVQLQIARIAKKTAADPQFEYAHVTIVEIIGEMVTEFTTNLINAATSGTSRSSNTMANACEDVERAAKAKFVRDVARGW